jgi:hypothetical protein
MKTFQQPWLNIKIYFLWRLQFLIGRLKNHLYKKQLSYNENKN